MDEYIGKLSDDRKMSGSRLASMFGLNKYSSPGNEFRRSREAIDKNVPRLEQNEITPEAAIWGNITENPILNEGAKRLGLKINTQIKELYVDEELDLQASLDSILEGDGSVWKTDISKGIYVIGADSIQLKGPGVGEAKLTGANATDIPAPYRGPIQVQAQLMCTGFSWGAIFTLYRGVELRIYLMPVDPEMQQKIREVTSDFNSRIEAYKRDGTIDHYNPLSQEDAAATWNVIEEGEEPIELKGRDIELAHTLFDAKRAEKAIKKQIKLTETALMGVMGNHSVALAKKDGQTFEVSWPLNGEKKFKARPAEPARIQPPARAKTLKVKETP